MDETRSLRAEELDATESHPYLKVSQPTPYEPDLAAYAVDEANDPYRRFTASVESGATIQLRVACRDGRREILDLSNIEARAWIRDPLEDRTAFVNAKICERRATSPPALKASKNDPNPPELDVYKVGRLAAGRVGRPTNGGKQSRLNAEHQKINASDRVVRSNGISSLNDVSAPTEVAIQQPVDGQFSALARYRTALTLGPRGASAKSRLVIYGIGCFPMRD
jgi:hypothetical protein